MFRLPQIKVHKADTDADETAINKLEAKDDDDAKSISETRAKYPETELKGTSSMEETKNENSDPYFEDVDKISLAKDELNHIESESKLKTKSEENVTRKLDARNTSSAKRNFAFRCSQLTNYFKGQK